MNDTRRIEAKKGRKRARERAHKSFDKLWKSGIMSRGYAYLRLKKYMELKDDRDCHISEFTPTQCNQVILFSEAVFGGMDPEKIKREIRK